jgi:hypothetical protein
MANLTQRKVISRQRASDQTMFRAEASFFTLGNPAGPYRPRYLRQLHLFINHYDRQIARKKIEIGRRDNQPDPLGAVISVLFRLDDEVIWTIKIDPYICILRTAYLRARKNFQYFIFLRDFHAKQCSHFYISAQQIHNGLCSF